MKKRLGKTLCITSAMVLCFSSGVLAAGNIQSITAQINRGISVKLDGKTQTMYDATGKRVYPVIYQGTTYLPVRSISNMLGVDIAWDNATSSVLLGEGAGNIGTSVKPYEVKNGTIFDGAAAKSFTVSGQAYKTGFTLRGRSISSESYALLSTSGKKTLSFDVGHIDGTGSAKLDLGIFLNDSCEKTVNVSATQGVKHIEIDLDGASVVKLQFLGEAGYFSGEYGFFNIQLK